MSVPTLADAPMLESLASCPYPGRRLAFPNRGSAVSALQAPRQNLLLAALPLEDYELLLPDLDAVPLLPGSTIHSAGNRERYVYFLTAGIVSRFCMTECGESAEFALAGHEGVIGIAAFLSGESTPAQAVVLSAGYAYRLGSIRLKREFEHDGPLPRLLLAYTRALIAQTVQIAMCNRFHSLEQRLCRWMLSCLDRLTSSELTLTQELIAEKLGVRRVGVTEALGRLQEAQLIQSGRGHVAVLDRPGLEARACECYAIVKREYDRLLPARGYAEFLSWGRPLTEASRRRA